jgi:hypothetical protein
MSHERQIRNSNEHANERNERESLPDEENGTKEFMPSRVYWGGHTGGLFVRVCVCVHWKTNDWLDGNIIEVGVAVFCFFLFVREITKTTTKEKSSNYFASTFFWSNRVALIGEVRNSFARREKKRGRRKIQ